MSATTTAISDQQLFEAARRAFVCQRVALEDWRVAGNAAENELRLWIIRRHSRKWTRVATAASRSELLLKLETTKRDE